MPAHDRLREEDPEFEASLSYIVRLLSQKNLFGQDNFIKLSKEVSLLGWMCGSSRRTLICK
jgi:hypothetical protein